MIEQRVEDLPAAAPRWLMIRALLRASLTATVLVVLYFTLPLTGSLDGSAALLLVVGLLVFTSVVTWQVRAVLRSRHPGLRAIEALAAAVPLFLLVFAAAYLRMADADGGAFSEPLGRTDALYFTITVFSTVGFGDVTPKTDLARVATMVQMLGDLLVVGGYLTAQHGKNHLVDRNEYVPGRQPSNAGVAQVGEGEPTASVSPSAGCGSGNHARGRWGQPSTDSTVALAFASNHTDASVIASTSLKHRTSHCRPGPSSAGPLFDVLQGTQAQFS